MIGRLPQECQIPSEVYYFSLLKLGYDMKCPDEHLLLRQRRDWLRHLQLTANARNGGEPTKPAAG